ncbi:MAG TPA: DNA polymerase [Planctomycetaceae bacterium]
MKSQFGDRILDFKTWQPKLGKVFDRKPIAFDCETELINEKRSWIVPNYVIGAAFDGARGYFVPRQHVAAFFLVHCDCLLIFHHAVFDLAVIDAVVRQDAVDFDVYDLVERNRVRDSRILHRLYVLATEGHTASHAGESTLERCAQTYLGIQLPKDTRDSHGDTIRTSYGKWLGAATNDIEAAYLEYLARDVIATFGVYRTLRSLIQNTLDNSQAVWGFVSSGWLKEQIRRWGLLTHNIQLKGSIVLDAVTRNGIRIDQNRVTSLNAELKRTLSDQRAQLSTYGYWPGKDSNKSLQTIFTRLEEMHPDVTFTRTAKSGHYCTAHDAICGLADKIPFIRLLLAFRATDKLLNSFVTKLNRRVLHPSFEALNVSGRTSSFGEMNAQNLPRDARVRSCFVAGPGSCFLDFDYKTIELGTLAQSCLSQFNLPSKMAEAINSGQDLHRLVAASVMGKRPEDVTPEERSRSKPINFGLPGGMGSTTLRQMAMADYGLDMSVADVNEFSKAWFDQFPEMRTFLEDTCDPCIELAAKLGLTLRTHFRHTHDNRFLSYGAATMDQPSGILGGMLLKTLRVQNPTTGARKPYSKPDRDYFWSQVQALAEQLPPALRDALSQRQPSAALAEAVAGLVGAASVFTLTGRLRANSPLKNSTFDRRVASRAAGRRTGRSPAGPPGTLVTGYFLINL